MRTPHKHAAVIKAWANGDEIEWSFDGLDWHSIQTKSPSWEELLQYRVKPVAVTMLIDVKTYEQFAAQYLTERAARDIAVAEAVRDKCYVGVMNCAGGHEGTVVRQINLAAIIAGVPK